MDFELRAFAESRKRETALVWREAGYTGESLDVMANALAERLTAAGVGPRRRLAILLGNSPAFVVSLLAALKVGAGSVLLHIHVTDEELVDALRRTEPTVLLANQGLAARLTQATSALGGSPTVLPGILGLAMWRMPNTRDVGDPGEMTVQFTSGTGGRSKIVPRRVTHLADELESFASQLGLGPQDSTLCPSALSHTYGLVNGFLLPFFSGRTAILADWFLPNDVLDLARRCQPRVLVGVPVMYKTLAEAYGASPSDLASLRFCFSAGAPLAPHVWSAFHARYGRQIHQQYGTTETGVIALNLLERPAANPSAAGNPVRGRAIDVVDDSGTSLAAGEAGNVVVRSPSTTDGYLDDAPATAASFRDGRYFTGDLGTLGRDGALTLTGRRTTFINVAGLKVDPAEVEHVLAACDGVTECAVVPFADSSGGQVVRAVVVARHGLSATDLQRFCRRRLAAHKVPRHVTFVDALPRNAAGKVITKLLIEH